MQIGTLDLGSRPLLLAPMEDVSDAPFRLLCKQFGASLVYTEFISADALVLRPQHDAQDAHRP